MPTNIRNEIPTPKQQDRNEEALKSAQQRLDKVVKNPFSATLQAIKNEMRQLRENSQTKKPSRRLKAGRVSRP
jgi:hypothetical protein